MTIKKCNKCGAEIREFPGTQTILPKYYIYRYDSWLTKEYIDFCQDCVKKFDKWLEYKGDDDEVKKLKEEISKLEAENIRLRDQIDTIAENETKYYKEKKRWVF